MFLQNKIWLLGEGNSKMKFGRMYKILWFYSLRCLVLRNLAQTSPTAPWSVQCHHGSFFPKMFLSLKWMAHKYPLCMYACLTWRTVTSDLIDSISVWFFPPGVLYFVVCYILAGSGSADWTLLSHVLCLQWQLLFKLLYTYSQYSKML